MNPSEHKLIVCILWVSLFALVLPASLLAVNPVTDVSLFNYAFALTGEPDFTVTISIDGFQPDTVSTTVMTDTVVEGVFMNVHSDPVTVTFPEGMFGPGTSVIDNGGVITVSETSPQGGRNVVTATVNSGGFRLNVDVLTQAFPHVVGGEVVSNPFILMLPAMILVLLVGMILYARNRVRKISDK